MAFHRLNSQFKVTSTPDLMKSREKWNVDKTSCLAKFRYDGQLDISKLLSGKPELEVTAFLLQFLNSDAFQQHFRVIAQNRAPAPLGYVESLQWRKVEASLTDLSIFDALTSSGVIRESGDITKCYEEEIDGVMVSDELRNIIFNEESEHFSQFSYETRQQLLFRLFRHLVLGGSLCQYEDNANPYLESVKLLYKDMLAVRKNKTTDRLEVASIVLELLSTAPAPAGFVPAVSAAAAASSSPVTDDTTVNPLISELAAKISVSGSNAAGNAEVKSASADDEEEDAEEVPIAVKASSSKPAPAPASAASAAAPPAPAPPAPEAPPAKKLFPSSNSHNLCFAAIDPVGKTITVYYFAFVPYW